MSSLDNSFNFTTENSPLSSPVSINKDIELAFRDKERRESKQKAKKLKTVNFLHFILAHLLDFFRDNIIIALATLCYMISLIGCYDEYLACIKVYKDYGTLAISLIVLASFLYVLHLVLIIQRKARLYTLLIMCLTIAFLCFYYDTETNVESHGGYNRVFLFILIVLFSSAYLFTRVLKFIFLKFYSASKLACLLSIVVIFILGFFSLHNKIVNSCEDWDKGFKNTAINNNDPNSCIIKKPSICYENIFDNLLDVTWYTGFNCDNNGNGTKEKTLGVFSLMYNNNYTVVGYPRTESWDFEKFSLYKLYQNYVLGYVIEMNDVSFREDLKKDIEVTVDYIKTPPKAEVKLKKNEELLGIRKANQTDLNAKNVIILFVDSISRTGFKRKLKKVYTWLENFYAENNNKNKNKNNTEFESFQFLKYHAIADYTTPNMFPLLFGAPHNNSVGREIVIDFKSKGYITASTMNQCSRSPIDIWPGPGLQKKWGSHDHELNSIFCDPNFSAPDQNHPLLNGPYAIIMKCLYNRPTMSYSIDYAQQFLEAYKDQPKYLRIGDINSHEGTGEVIKYDDDQLYSFLEYMRVNGHLDNSVLFVLSDHGYTMPGFHNTFRTEDHMKDLFLPFLSIVVSKKLKDYQIMRGNLKHYENLLLSPYDIHRSLISLLEKKADVEYKKDSLFYISKNETDKCEKFLGDIKECRCELNNH
jgi:hypothetical protein